MFQFGQDSTSIRLKVKVEVRSQFKTENEY